MHIHNHVQTPEAIMKQKQNAKANLWNMRTVLEKVNYQSRRPACKQSNRGWSWLPLPPLLVKDSGIQPATSRKLYEELKPKLDNIRELFPSKSGPGTPRTALYSVSSTHMIFNYFDRARGEQALLVHWPVTSLSLQLRGC